MVSLQGFDANKIDPAAPMAAVPPGDYTCVIESSEQKPTKKGDGKYLELVLQIVDGKHKGRKLWDRLNIWNPSKAASDIAQSQLSSICHAVGILKPKDSAELHNKPLKVTVKTEKYEGNFVNRVAGYGSASGGKDDGEFSEKIDAKADAEQDKKTLEEMEVNAPWS